LINKMKLSEQLAGQNFGPKFSQAISAADDQIEYLREKGLNQEADLFARQISDKINKRDESIAGNLSALGQVYSANLKTTKSAGEKEKVEELPTDLAASIENLAKQSQARNIALNPESLRDYADAALIGDNNTLARLYKEFDADYKVALDIQRKEKKTLQRLEDNTQVLVGEQSGTRYSTAGLPLSVGDINTRVVNERLAGQFSPLMQAQISGDVGVPYQPQVYEQPVQQADGKQVITRIDPATGKVEIVEAFNPQQAKEKRAQEAKESKAVTLTQDLFEIKRRYSDLEPQGGVIPAMSRIVAGNIPGTETRSLKSIIDRVKSSLTLEEIQSMRQNSPTGASLGNVSDKDVAIVRDAATSLEGSQTPEAFNREWLRLTEKLLDVAYGAKNQRDMLVKKGELTQDQNEEIDLLYPSETINAKGEIVRRRGVSQTRNPALIDPQVQGILNKVAPK